jgi:small ligand-binding sensory domain FIST
VLELDGQPALDVMLDELGITLSEPVKATQTLRQTFVGLKSASEASEHLLKQRSFDAQTRVRHLVGLDPLRRGFAVADFAPEGSELTFCERNVQAARRDLMRIGAEIREELEPEEAFDGLLSDSGGAINLVALGAQSIRANGTNHSKNIVGAIYVSCAGRGGPHFGGESAELQILRHALGDVPLVGFFAGGEIAHQQVHGYTGVLTVFTADAVS